MDTKTVDQNDAGILNDHGLALADQVRFDDAIEQYREADKLWKKAGSPDRKLALTNWANALRLKKQYDESIKKYREALAVDPNFANAHNGIGLVLADQVRFDDAIEQYREADKLWTKAGSPDRKLALTNWGGALRVKKQYDESIKKYREALAVDPDDANAHNELGRTLLAQDRFDDAIEQYREADKLWKKAGSPDQKIALFNWANALRSKKQYDESIKRYREALAVDPTFANAHNGIGLVLADQDRFADAIEQYREADKLWEKDKSTDRKFALWNWGRALRAQERFDDAIAKYDEATIADPNDAMGFFFYGNSFTACWRYRDGITQFERATLLDSKNPYHYHNKAHALFQLGRYEEGWNQWWLTRNRYEAALPVKLRSEAEAEDALYFGDLLREIFSEYAESEQYYRRAIERRNDNASAWTGLAMLYQQWAESEKAPPEILARLAYAVRRAEELLRSPLGKKRATSVAIVARGHPD
jgi:tetratricopeptide (TPR) repeat protein